MDLNINKIFKDYMRDKQKIVVCEDASDDEMHAGDWLYQQNNGTPAPFKFPQTTVTTTSTPLPPTTINKSMLGGYDAAVKYSNEHPGRSVYISPEKNPITGKYPVGVKIDPTTDSNPVKPSRPHVDYQSVNPQGYNYYKNIQGDTYYKYNDNSDFWSGTKKSWGGRVSPDAGPANLPLKSNIPTDNAAQLNRLWNKYNAMAQPNLPSAGSAPAELSNTAPSTANDQNSQQLIGTKKLPPQKQPEIGLPPKYLPGTTQLQKDAINAKLPPPLDKPSSPAVLNNQPAPSNNPAGQPATGQQPAPSNNPAGQPATGQQSAQFDPTKQKTPHLVAQPTTGQKMRTWLNTNVGRGVGDFAYNNPVLSGLMVGAPIAVLAAGAMNRNQNRR